MNEGNFLAQVNGIITGKYFLAERVLPLFDAVRVAATGVPCTAASAPTAVTKGIQFDDSETATLSIVVPFDYDPAADVMELILSVVPSADAAHTTDIGLTTAQNLFRNGAAVDATVVDAVAEDAVASTGALVREVVLDISGQGYQPGDVIQRVLDVNNSGTTELILLGMKLRYGSSFVAYDPDERPYSA
jgi:hypothetical protein